MTSKQKQPSNSSASRRKFLQVSTATLIGGATASTRKFASSARAGGSDLLRVGLIGCGGRGTGAASEALRADENVKLMAMGDVFEDRLQSSLQKLQKKEDIVGKIDVPPDRRFIGFDAYQEVIDSGVDVVLLAAPPHFRPLHLRAAIDAGKHVFAEKPVAVDAPGVRSILETCDIARKRNLSVVTGLCLRYSNGFKETVSRLHDGAIGEIHTLQANDYRGGVWLKPRQPDWTNMHWQMRNWYYFTWLSGDFNVEQHVHFLDICAWIMKDTYPITAIGMGGRQVRTGEEYGNIYDHHSVTYEYENGAKLFSSTRQMRGCQNEISAQAAGSKGKANLSERRKGLNIIGDDKWTYPHEDNNFYQTEHDELFASIRNGTPINNGLYMAKSTLLAIMGRMATYTGQRITWDEAINSKEDLTPPKYEWGPIETPPAAIPGITKFY